MLEKPLIFISYARRDSAAVNMLEAQLNRWRFRPWVDRQKLIGGQQWNNQIEQAIAQCELFLLVLTSDALGSLAVLHELRYARSHGKRILLLQFQTPPIASPEIQGLPIVPIDSNLDRSVTRLYDAIDRFGVHAPPLSGNFNGERALVAATFQRAPTTWAMHAVTPGRYWLPAFMYVSQVIVFVVIFLALLINHRISGGAITGLIVLSYPLIRMGVCIEIARGVYATEKFVITPEGFAVRELQSSFLKASFQVKQYAFDQMQTLHIAHLFPGVTALRIKNYGAATPQIRYRISGRFRQRKVIAAQVVAAFQAAKNPATQINQLAPVPTIPVPHVAIPTTPIVNTPTFAQPAIAPRLFLCAVATDQPFLQQLQQRLSGRHLAWYESPRLATNPAQLNQAMDASNVVFVVISAASVESNELRLHYLYALGHHKIVIPLLLDRGQQNLPTELKGLQWIDCTKKIDTEIWRLDIINALARVGIFQADNGFDGELALAQAFRQQLPPSCQGYRVTPSAYQTMRMDNMNRAAISGALTAIIMSILLFALVIMSLLSLHILGDIGGIILALLSFSGCGVMGVTAAALLQRSRFQRWLQREKIVPELFVVTPAGFAIHHFTITPFPHMQSHTYAFCMLADMRVRKTMQRGLRITITSRDGHRKRLALRPEFDVTDEIMDRLMRAFKVVA